MELFGQKHQFTFQLGSNETGVFQADYHVPRAEVSLILEGSANFTVDGKSREQVKGPALTFQSYQRRLEVTLDRRSRTRTMWCHFSTANFSASQLEWLAGLPPVMPLNNGLDGLFRSASELLGLQAQPLASIGDYGRQACDALGAAIFAGYIRCAAQEKTLAPALPHGVARLCRAVQQNLTTGWDGPRMAAIAGLSEKYLITLFAKHLGETPVAYVWRQRAEAGLAMLERTGASVEDIAFRCGYKSAAHFSRSIKARYGRSPRDIRAALPTRVALMATESCLPAATGIRANE